MLFRSGKSVSNASYSSDKRRWTLQVINKGHPEPLEVSCQWLHVCTGYYDYEKPFRPHFDGEEDFKGEIVHPQLWKDSTDCTGKRVVVIGSGATAVTLLPSLADQVDHITMLQRSPSYFLALPQHNRLVAFLQIVLPQKVSHLIIKWMNLLLSWLLFVYCTTFTESAKKLLLKGVQERLPRLAKAGIPTPD